MNDVLGSLIMAVLLCGRHLDKTRGCVVLDCVIHVIHCCFIISDSFFLNNVYLCCVHNTSIFSTVL